MSTYFMFGPSCKDVRISSNRKGFNYNALSKVVDNRILTKRGVIRAKKSKKFSTKTWLLLVMDLGLSESYTCVYRCVLCLVSEGFSIINNPFNRNWRKLNFQLSISYIIYFKEDQQFSIVVPSYSYNSHSHTFKTSFYLLKHVILNGTHLMLSFIAADVVGILFVSC